MSHTVWYRVRKSTAAAKRFRRLLFLVLSASLLSAQVVGPSGNKLTGKIQWSLTATLSYATGESGISHITGNTGVSLVFRNGRWEDDGTSTIAGSFRRVINAATCTQTGDVSVPQMLWTTLRDKP